MVLRTIDHEIVPVCEDCSSDWNLYGYLILKRIKPGRDEKLLTAWNGMMIDAMASAGAALEEQRYVNAAERAADWLLANMRTDQGRLLRTAHLGSGQPAKLNAYLEDYAYLIDALVTLYEATFEPRWIALKRREERFDVGLAERTR